MNDKKSCVKAQVVPLYEGRGRKAHDGYVKPAD